MLTYDEASQSWNQKGSDLSGQNSFDSTGVGVSLSYDGSMSTVGSIGYDMDPLHPYDPVDNGDESGLVQIYGWSTATGDWEEWYTWQGDTTEGLFGFPVVVSGDCTTIAAAGILHQSGGDVAGTGKVSIYQWSRNAWANMGPVFEGTIPISCFGWGLDLSTDGTTLLA